MAKFTDIVRDKLIGYFNAGDQPTEAQFTEWMNDIQDGIDEHDHTGVAGGDGIAVLAHLEADTEADERLITARNDVTTGGGFMVNGTAAMTARVYGHSAGDYLLNLENAGAGEYNLEVNGEMHTHLRFVAPYCGMRTYQLHMNDSPLRILTTNVAAGDRGITIDVKILGVEKAISGEIWQGYAFAYAVANFGVEQPALVTNLWGVLGDPTLAWNGSTLELTLAAAEWARYMVIVQAVSYGDEIVWL